MSHFSSQPFDVRFDRLGSIGMEVKGLRCVFNLPPALQSRFDQTGEVAQPLPPYARQVAFSVDQLNDACPQHWERGSDVASSYMVPV